MVLACINAQKTECGCLRAGKLKTVMYVYLPRHKEAHKENAASKQASKCTWQYHVLPYPRLGYHSIHKFCFVSLPCWKRPQITTYSRHEPVTFILTRGPLINSRGVKSRLLFVSFSAPNCHASYHWLPKLLPFLMVKKTKPIVSRVSLMR